MLVRNSSLVEGKVVMGKNLDIANEKHIPKKDYQKSI